MRSLKVHKIYRHFKGKKYIVIGVSKPVEVLFNCDAIHTVFHTELEVNIGLSDHEGKYYHSKSIDKQLLVIYKQISLDTKIYARPMDMFLSEVDKKKYPHIKQKYRMEEVR